MAPRPTHFLCLPIVPQSHAFLAHLSNLKHDLRTVSTSDSATTGLPPAAVRPVGTLHFTLGVMNLDDSNRARAIDVMRGLVGGSEGKGLSVTLKGLRSIGRENGASVLYMAPENNGQVESFCNKARDAFVEAGLIDGSRPLLLHATLVNTIYVSGRDRTRGQGNKRLVFDARNLVTNFENTLWMQNTPLKTLAICRMGAKKYEDGEEAYEVEASIDIS